MSGISVVKANFETQTEALTEMFKRSPKAGTNAMKQRKSLVSHVMAETRTLGIRPLQYETKRRTRVAVAPGFRSKERRAAARGFSLIELLIVVAIILIIAAIAIPNLLRSRMAANEASAVGSIRTINTGAISFNSSYGDGFPSTLAQIGTTGTAAVSCANSEYINSVLTSGTKSGYTFAMGPGVTKVALVPVGCAAGYVDGYTVTAVPATLGTTGQRSFCSDATGVIRYDPTGAAPAVAGGLCPVALNPLQ